MYNFSESFYGSASLGYAIVAEGEQDGGFVYSFALNHKFSDLKIFGFYKSVVVSGGSFDNFGLGLVYNYN